MDMQNHHFSASPGRLAAGALLAALALAACGDDGGENNDPPDARAVDARPPIDGATPIDARPIDAAPIDAVPGIDAVGTLGYDLYLRGSFNNHDTSAKFEVQADGTYRVTENIPIGAHELKIADETWNDERTWSLDADAEIEVTLDAPATLVLAAGLDNNARMTITAGEEDEYLFVVDAANPAAPILTVSRVP
jgi:hypothetical protein